MFLNLFVMILNQSIHTIIILYLFCIYFTV